MYNNTTACFSCSNISGALDNVSLLYIIHVSTSIAVAILSPVAVAGNALVLAAIWRNQSLRTPSYILLAGLAFTDFSTGLISQPFYIAMELIYLADPQLKTVVKRQTFLIIPAIANGFVTYFVPMTMAIITVMSIERWLHMTRRYLITVRRVCYIVAAFFLLPIPFAVLRVLSILHDDTTDALNGDIGSVSFLLFCLIVTSITYFKVFRIIRSHQQQIQANYLPETFGQPAINFAKYKKSVFTVLYILAIFYVSYSPLIIYFGVSIFWGGKETLSKKSFSDVAMVFVFLSSSLNPILYMWRMSDIRNEVKSLGKAILCKSN